ncbi:MAG: glycosyltransferase [Candidatus Delongbacteria bacterium]|nr:glycosyltransferase [Candidatus Delongbacteria bacterium]MDD4204503.1 glycosyltransferase [Candidatus Delongbacteria bacterium]
MNIAYVHTGDWPSNSPSTTFATYNCIGLSKNSEKCHFFIKRNSKKFSDELFHEYFNIKKPDNLIIHQITRPLLNSNFFYYRKIYKELSLLIKSGSLDAVITRSVTFLPYLIKLKNRFNVKVYFESHDFFADLSLRNDININKKVKQSKIENKFIPQLTGLICLQEAQSKLYLNIFTELQSKVFRTGILNYHKTSSNKQYISYIGSLDTLKGVETLIESLKYTTTKPKLLIIGGKDKEEIEKIETFINNTVPEAEIIISGWINKKKLDELLKETILGIVPMRDTFFNRFLTSPLKLFDFYSYGIPVICSDLPTGRELISENKTGLFFEPGNPKDLAKKIDSLLIDENKITEMSSYIFEKTSDLLWESRGNKIIEWIKEHE